MAISDKTYCVYCHTNKINGKRYIGQTCQKPEQRWQNGNGYKGQRFYNAIQLYGWDNFSHEILAEGLTKEEADQREIQLIGEFNTTNPLFGYNISLGGTSGTTGRHHTEESRKKMSKSKKGHYFGKDNPMFGRHHTEETKRKISEAAKNRSIEKQINILKSKGCLPIKCVETGIIYYSSSAAADFAKVSPVTIKGACNGDQKTAGGYHWQRVTWEEYYAQEGGVENV